MIDEAGIRTQQLRLMITVVGNHSHALACNMQSIYGCHHPFTWYHAGHFCSFSQAHTIRATYLFEALANSFLNVSVRLTDCSSVVFYFIDNISLWVIWMIPQIMWHVSRCFNNNGMTTILDYSTVLKRTGQLCFSLILFWCSKQAFCPQRQ